MNKNPQRQATPFELQRRSLIESLRGRGIQNEDVLRAMYAVPREAFVPEALAMRAYEDSALPIEKKQTISQPYTVAIMTQTLDLSSPSRVLEIGTGSGYQAAVLAAMGHKVVSIERHAALSQRARTTLHLLGFDVVCRIGDGTIGYREGGPYDGIIVTAGAPDVPEILARQLTIGGKMVIPVGTLVQQELYRVVRTAEESWKAEPLGQAKFVPLIGRSGWDETTGRS
ncbi:MAG: protein-L-isoaspartate(D-aspartate) O-methyltransferase [Candidatus Kapabacteria bacterium]|nr:protein-L-isoaspartate(D-aspartate) O-methyltransferase [Candidatus Kapabacteria bacterium]